MKIVVNLDVMMARRKMSLGELAQRVDITMANLSILKNNKARAIRFSTLEAICAALDCQPGDILEFVPDGEGSHELDQKAQKAGAISGAGPDISGLVVAAESIYSRAMGSPAR